MSNSLPLRPAVRGLVIDADNSVLMVRLVFPDGAWWVLPGGGIDSGEDHSTALHRELAEEVGLVGATIGPPVWERTHHFHLIDTDGVEWSGQTEVVYIVRTERFDPSPHFSEEQLRAEGLHEHKWWTIDDIASYCGTDSFAPPNIAEHLFHIVNHGLPDSPFVIIQTT